IYKDKRLVNWDPRLQTAVSDLEVENLEIKGHLWHVKYPIEDQPGEFIIVATTRPETMLGDTAVAVHPDDARYTGLVGKHAGLSREAARRKIVADLEAGGLLEKTEAITHSVTHDEKTKAVVLEPFLTEQWYLNVQPLADKAIAAVEKGETKFVPANWADVFFG